MLNTAERKETTYFIGNEVEHTICYGKKTLFVVGIQPADTIIDIAKNNNCEHIYFGTSQSFNPSTDNEWNEWNEMIVSILTNNFWVTLDFDVKYSELMTDFMWNDFQKFVPMISVKIPHINLYNYNATLKLDDTTWGATNPGVWTHHLPSLMTKENFTHWEQYTDDEEI